MLLILITLLFGFIIILYVFSPLISPNSLKLDGLHVLITGGSSGIGKYIAIEAVTQGANITIFSRNQDKLYKAKNDIEKYVKNNKQKIVCVSIDVSKDFFIVKSAITKAELMMGRHVDVLVNCAGFASLALFDELPIKEFKNLMDVNYLGSVYTTRCVLENMKKGSTICMTNQDCKQISMVNHDTPPNECFNNNIMVTSGDYSQSSTEIPSSSNHQMECDTHNNIDGDLFNRDSNEQGYRIMFVSSQAGQVGLYGCSGYSASKFALRGLAESLQMEVKPYNIRITLAFPPDTDTPGYAQENLTKPSLTKEICQTSGLYNPQVVAKILIQDLKKGKFTSYIGLDGYLLNSLTCGMSPITTITEAIEQVCTMSLFRIISLFYLDSFDRMIQKHVTDVEN